MNENDKKYNQQQQEERHDDPKQTQQRNPRLVVGALDYFDVLMEQDEQV